MAKTFIEKLLADDEGRKLYFREDLIFEVTENICKVMEEKGISKADLSRRAGVSKSNITQLLSGDHNMRLTTIADLLYAIDSKLAVSAVPLDIDSVLAGTTLPKEESWIRTNCKPQESEYKPVNEKERKELTQAA